MAGSGGCLSPDHTQGKSHLQSLAFSYLGKLAGATLSPAHILLFNIITPTNKELYLIPYGAWHYYSYFLVALS